MNEETKDNYVTRTPPQYLLVSIKEYEELKKLGVLMKVKEIEEIRQQTLEEAIGSVGKVRYTRDMLSTGWNRHREQTLSNLQTLKDKNK